MHGQLCAFQRLAKIGRFDVVANHPGSDVEALVIEKPTHIRRRVRFLAGMASRFNSSRDSASSAIV